MKFIDLTGKKFGKLTVICKGNNFGKGNYRWLCKCECGNTKEILRDHLVNGKIKSCGCLKKTSHYTVHNKTHTRLYPIWIEMKKRCYNSKNKSYKNYGGRGIKVCDEWKNNFLNFYNWAMGNGYNENANKGECTIDRIDNNGNYEPSNCRWITNLEQANNKRNNIRISINGETHTISEWCRKYNVSYKIVYKRIKKGLSPMEALTIPKVK